MSGKRERDEDILETALTMGRGALDPKSQKVFDTLMMDEKERVEFQAQGEMRIILRKLALEDKGKNFLLQNHRPE